MSDTAAPTTAPTAAPAAPAAAPTAEAPKPHHSALQPRAPQGTFAGAPDPSKAPAAPTATPAAVEEPPKPKSWKLGDREVTNPDDLYTEAQAALAERQALAAHAKRAAEAEKKAKELEAKMQNKRALLSEEDVETLILERARAWQEEQAILALPPEQQQVVRMRQQLARERAQLEAEKTERQRLADEEKRQKEEAEQQQKDAAMVEEFKGHVGAALKSAGLEPTATNYKRVGDAMRGGLLKGVLYPPEVLGARVKAAMAHEARQSVESAPVDALTSDAVIAKLAAIEDVAVLRRIAQSPLGEKIRRLNLADKGMTPVPAARTPTAPAPVDGEIDTSKLAPGDPQWAEVLERRLKAR